MRYFVSWDIKASNDESYTHCKDLLLTVFRSIDRSMETIKEMPDLVNTACFLNSCIDSAESLSHEIKQRLTISLDESVKMAGEKKNTKETKYLRRFARSTYTVKLLVILVERSNLSVFNWPLVK